MGPPIPTPMRATCRDNSRMGIGFLLRCSRLNDITIFGELFDAALIDLKRPMVALGNVLAGREGYEVIARNHRTRFGELDLVLVDGASINEAWGVLSDAARRARWDRAHTIVQPAPWAPRAPVDPPPVPVTPPVETTRGAWKRPAGFVAVPDAPADGVRRA